jgi:hypothetical protein
MREEMNNARIAGIASPFGAEKRSKTKLISPLLNADQFRLAWIGRWGRYSDAYDRANVRLLQACLLEVRDRSVQYE